MKKIILLTSMLLLLESTFSRDKIILFINQGITTKFSKVKYKKFGLKYAPDFSIKSSQNKMIDYRNGVFSSLEIEKTISKNENNFLAIDNFNPPFIPSGKKQYMYNNQLVNEREMYEIMLQENDPELHLLIKKAKKARDIEFTGFVAVPIFIFSFSALVASSMSANRVGPEPDGTYVMVSAVGGVAAIAVGVTGIVFSVRHTRWRADAVKRYNQKF